MKPSMSDHPEIRSGEIFLTNTDLEGFCEIGWKTKRRGDIAYDIHGKVIYSSDLFPVFVQTSELPPEVIESLRHYQERTDKEFE